MEQENWQIENEIVKHIYLINGWGRGGNLIFTVYIMNMN